jgi:nucleotide-binding universal stress UspA family protein
MFEVRRILAPVDFSPCSKKALEYATFLADKLGASVDVLHAWTLPAQGEATLESLARENAEKEMEAFMKTCAMPAGMERVRSLVRFGAESATILETAKDYDLLVMGTNGRTGISRLLLGSIAEEVVRKASCPVVTVRGA